MWLIQTGLEGFTNQFIVGLILFCLSHFTIALCPYGCTCDEERLIVSCDGANLDSIPISLNPILGELVLNRNRIRSLETSSFIFYRQLKVIDVSNNRIDRIADGSFSLQSNLSQLHLNDNRLTWIGSFTFKNISARTQQKGLGALTFLNLQNNILEEIEPDAFSYTPNLIRLDLANNSLSSISPYQLFGLAKLTQLNLERNRITQIPIDFSNNLSLLQQLRELRLGHNPISSIYGYGFSSLSSLQILDMRGCHLTFMHHFAFEGLTELKEIVLAGNKLVAIPSPGFHSLPKLEVLDVGFNPIEKLEKQFLNPLPNLKGFKFDGALELIWIDSEAFILPPFNMGEIEISGAKKLTSLPFNLFGSVKTLKKLILKNNGFVSLPSDLADWNTLDLIDISGNPIRCSCDNLWLNQLIYLPNLQNSTDDFAQICGVSDQIGSNLDVTLNCNRNESLEWTIMAGCLVGIVILMLGIFFFLIYKFNQPISNCCQAFCLRDKNSTTRSQPNVSEGPKLLHNRVSLYDYPTQIRYPCHSTEEQLNAAQNLLHSYHSHNFPGRTTGNHIPSFCWPPNSTYPVSPNYEYAVPGPYSKQLSDTEIWKPLPVTEL